MGNALAGQPYQAYDPNQRFAGFNPDQTASFDAARAAAGAGAGDVAQAGQIGGLLGSFSAPTVGSRGYTATSAGGFDPSQLASPYLPSMVKAQQITAGNLGKTNLDPYLNPYTKDVVDTSLADLSRAKSETDAKNAAAAAATGAFGGARHGVTDSLTNRDYLSQVAATSANLRNAGFTNAQQAATGDLNRTLSADQGNQAADFQGQVANQGAGLQSGLAAKNQLFQSLLANLQNNQFNAGQANTASQFSANAANDAARTNAANAIAAGGLRLNAGNLLSNIGELKQRMGANGADLLSRIGGQQQALDQAKKDFNYQQFVEKRNLPYQNIGLLNSILQGQRYGQTTTSSGTSTNPNPQRGSFLGTLGSLAGLIPGVGSAVSGLSGLFGGGGDGGAPAEGAAPSDLLTQILNGGLKF
jgi:hypothetical protein